MVDRNHLGALYKVLIPRAFSPPPPKKMKRKEREGVGEKEGMKPTMVASLPLLPSSQQEIDFTT